MSTITVELLASGALMVVCGIAKRRLAFRSAACPVCRRPRPACTCRWL